MKGLGKRVNLVKPIDVDRIPIKRDSFHAGAYVIELQLDSVPGYVWQTLFELEWKSSLHLWERKVLVTGDRLLLVTTPNEINEKIDWLRSVMESTNERLERFNQTQKITEDAKETEELAKHENVIRDTLRTKLALA